MSYGFYRLWIWTSKFWNFVFKGGGGGGGEEGGGVCVGGGAGIDNKAFFCAFNGKANHLTIESTLGQQCSVCITLRELQVSDTPKYCYQTS